MRRAQSALEYLITYGWAIVILVIVIVLLFYLGVLNPTGFVAVRNQVIGLNTIMVTDFVVNGTGSITLYLVNNAPTSINLTGIKIKDVALTSMSPSSYANWRPGANLTVTGISAITGGKGESFYNAKIEFNYTIMSGGTHVDTGQMTGKIE